MEYCCHVWGGTYICWIDNPQKRVYRTVGATLGAFLQLVTHHRKVASLDLFNSYYCCWCFLDWNELVSVPSFCGKPTCYSNKFSVTSLRCCKHVYVNNFFSLWAIYSRMLSLYNFSRWLVIYMFLSLDLIGTCYIWTLSNQLFYMLFIFVFFFFSLFYL